MSLIDLENALSLAAIKFGIKTDSSFPVSLKQMEIDAGTKFDSSLYGLIVSDFARSRSDFEYGASVVSSHMLYGLAVACEYWFARHYQHEFKILGTFDIDSVKRQLLEPERSKEKTGFDRTTDKMDEAHHPRSYVTIKKYATCQEFKKVDDGLSSAFGLHYEEVLDFLESKGEKIFRKLPQYMTSNFKLQVSKALELAQRDRPLDDYRREARKAVNVILKGETNATSDLKEWAIKSKEVLRKHFGTESLENFQQDKKTVVEMLKLTNDWVMDLEEDAEIAYVIE